MESQMQYRVGELKRNNFNAKEMQMIQSSMKELQQLFFDLALLVDDQGEMIDSIQVNVH